MTIIKDVQMVETILRNIKAVKEGFNLEYEKDGEMYNLGELDNSFHMLHKCSIKNEPLETWILMVNGKPFSGGGNIFYSSKKSAENYYDRYCGRGDSCRIIKLTEK